MATYSKAQIAESRERLLSLLSPGDTVHTKVLHVSRSGMMRVIAAYVIRDSEATDISRDAAIVIGSTFDRDRWGVKMGGCGMDMTFALVYSMSRSLWSNGVPCTGSNGYTPTGKRSKLNRCGSNDHSNGDRVYRKGKVHSDGGYALNLSHL